MPDTARPLGILAGGGSLPREIAEIATARGRGVLLVGIEGEAEPSFAPFPCASVNWGAIGGILAAFRTAGARELVLVGRVRRPDLRRLRPDLGFFRALPTILRLVRAGGDDGVLRGVIGFFEAKGFRVVSPAEVAPEIVVGRGDLGRHGPAAADLSDIEMGLDAVRRLGPFDIGQAVVVAGGRLEAIEGAEGTDAMLERVARQRAPGTPRGGVLVKGPKPGQDLRIDLPAIGPETVRGASTARLAGIAVDAGAVLAVRRRELVAAADEAGVFVTGCEKHHGAHEQRAEHARWCANNVAPPRGVRVLAGECGDGSLLADAAKGAAVISALVPYGVGRAVVVARGHVIAVEAGEGAEPAISRAAGLRQWGGRGRHGVAVLSRATDVDAQAIAAAAEAGLAALVLTAGAAPSALPAGAREVARRNGIAIAALLPEAPAE
jgi:DUF1009 family protein